jgi:hypothetical protein
MTGVYGGLRLIQARRWRAFAPCALAVAAPFAMAVALGTALEYVDPVNGGRLPLIIGLNPLAAYRVAWTFWLNFGPVLIVAAAGLAVALRCKTTPRLIPLLIALVVSTTFYFLVDVLDVQGVYAGLNIGKMMFIALTPLCAIAIEALWSQRGWVRWTGTTAIAVVALAALPTVLIDVYNTQDVWMRQMGPGFRWTVVLNPAEIEGLNWIKASTAKDARVQVEPVLRGRDTWAYITAFGERRMAGGIPLGMVPLEKYETISARVKGEIYEGTSAHTIHARSGDFCIDYLVVGEPERVTYPAFQALLEEDPRLFKRRFQNDGLAIYEVLEAERRRSTC